MRPCCQWLGCSQHHAVGGSSSSGAGRRRCSCRRLQQVQVGSAGAQWRPGAVAGRSAHNTAGEGNGAEALSHNVSFVTGP
jgi:hypothetical protein